MDIVKNWTTLELIEFLNSYNRIFNIDPAKVDPYKWLYLYAREELSKRSKLLAMLY